MGTTKRGWIFRVAAVFAGALWVAALFATFGSIMYGYASPQITANQPGRFLAEWGWLGPIQGSIAWYANLLLLWIMVRLVRGHFPGFKLPLIAAALSLSALLPEFVYDFEQDGKIHAVIIYGSAVWLWVGAFIAPSAIALLWRPRTSMHPKGGPERPG